MDKAPRRRTERCDYCNTDKGGLAAFCSRVCSGSDIHIVTFCGPYCAAWFMNCVYYRGRDKPDQFELPLQKPPEDRRFDVC